MEHTKQHRTLDHPASYALFGGFCGGCVGVAVDLDHLLCALQMGLPILPIGNIYGCKIWHDYIGGLGWGIGGLAVSCLVGFVLYMALHATQPTDDDNLLETRQAGESRRY